MGARRQGCTGAQVASRAVLLSAGSYDLRGIALEEGASLIGAGRDETIILGNVVGLENGMRLSRVRIEGTVVVRGWAFPLIEESVTRPRSPQADYAVECWEGASPTLVDCVIGGETPESSGPQSGFFCDGGAPTLRNCTISGGQAAVASTGGARPILTDCLLRWSRRGLLAQGGSNPVLKRCMIRETGTGVSCSGLSSPRLDNCAIRESRGSAVHSSGASPTLVNCLVEENEQGIAAFREPSVTLLGCVIRHNSISRPGSPALYASSSSPVLSSCRIERNGGGGISVAGASEAYFERCSIEDNAGAGLECNRRASPRLLECTLFRNLGGGIVAEQRAAPVIDHSTIVANGAEGGTGGPASREGAAPVVRSSILWSNDGGGIQADAASRPDVRHSCVEGSEPWPGAGNIAVDPLFCGWGDVEVAHVSASAASPGDGSAERPFADLASALQYDLALSSASPCLGAGEGGTDMGAPTGLCDGGGAAARTIELDAGSYRFEGLFPLPAVSIEGRSPEETELAGSVLGLGTGALLADLTVRGEIRTASHGAPVIRGCQVVESPASGILCRGDSRPHIVACRISASAGAGIECRDRSLPELTDCAILGSGGPGVLSREDSRPELLRCEISGSGGSGVEVRGGARARLQECSIRSSGGIGVLFEQSGGELVGCQIEENGEEGVVCEGEDADPRLTGCRIRGNHGLSQGGGVACLSGSPARLAGCEITGNISEIAGGGVYVEDEAAPRLVNCLIAGNRIAASLGFGGGVWIAELARPHLVNCTIVENRPGDVKKAGGIVSLSEFSPLLLNCIVWNNGPAPIWPLDRPRALVVIDSLLEEPFPGPSQGVVTADPLFRQPGRWDDGGTPGGLEDDVWTAGDYRLRPDSPALDRARSAGAPATDLDGRGRPCGAGVDIGAFESGGCEPVAERFRRGDVDGDGDRDVSDAIVLLLHLFAGGAEPGCLDGADANDDGRLEIADAVRILGYVFLAGPPLAPPFPDCGPDPTLDDLRCPSASPCAS